MPLNKADAGVSNEPHLVTRYSDSTWMSVVYESHIIGGGVALWRPMQTFSTTGGETSTCEPFACGWPAQRSN